MKNLRIIAHRSGPTIYPEQTILSARKAMENGADLVEVDVRFTKDEEIAISHDKNLKRIFGVDVELDALTANEFLTMRHCINREFPSHLFKDYLSAGIEPLLIHIKEERVINKLLEYIDQYSYADRIVLGVQSVELVKIIKEHNENIEILAFMPDVADIEKFAQAGVDYIRLWEQWLNKETESIVHSYNKELWIMTNGSEVGVTTEENLKKITEYNVDGILINDIRLLDIYK